MKCHKNQNKGIDAFYEKVYAHVKKSNSWKAEKERIERDYQKMVDSANRRSENDSR